MSGWHAFLVGFAAGVVSLAASVGASTRYQNGVPNTVGFSGSEIADAIAVLRTAADWLGQGGEATLL
jgi:hypothetical protein